MAGVSVASASFALNGQPGVADDTRRRILAIAEQLGYRANPQAQALRRGRTTTYGFVVRNFANPFFLEVLSGAEEVAGQAGVTLLVLDSRYSLERERRHLQEMAAQRLAGLAIAPVGTGESIRLWHELRPGAPVVALNASAARITGVCRVRPDNAAAVELPLRRLAELGHTSVAFLTAPRRLMADPDRLRHFRRLSRALGLRATVLYSPLTLGRRAAGHPATLLAGPGGPDRGHHQLRLHGARGVQGRAGAGPADRSRGLRRRARRPGHVRAAGPAAGDHLAEPAGDGPGADAAPARAGPAGRLRGPGRLIERAVPAGRRPPSRAARRGPARAGPPTGRRPGVLPPGEQWLAPRVIGNDP